jgi:hypothetical protein
MRRSIGGLMLVVLGITAIANAVVVNNFEQYADSAALNAEWQTAGNAGSVISLFQEEGGNKCLKLNYNTGDQYYAQVKYFLPGITWGTSGINWDYPGFKTISFDYKITDQGSTKTRFTVFNTWGGKIGGKDNGNGSVTNGWVHVELNLEEIRVKNAVPAVNYQNVGMLGISAQDTWSGGAVGELMIDNIVVPEPATMVILGLGGLLLRKRK